MIGDNENKDDFHVEKYFHQLVTVDNQDMFNVKEKIKPHFFIDFTKCIFANLVS